VVATNLCNYLLALPLMFVLGVIFDVHLSRYALFFPVVVAVQLVFILALSFLVSALNVAFRDLQHIVNNLLNLWFFATPIVYAADAVPDRTLKVSGLVIPWRPLFLYGNPMTVIIQAYRDIFYYHRLPDFLALGVVLGLSVALLWVATQIFEARREEFAELV
jgi:lipopolysaccharide transport system permease protein